jgi:nucleotide-binding universal stress UspA family protein
VERDHLQHVAFVRPQLGLGLAARFGFRRYREIVRPVERVPFPADAPRILVATRGDAWIVDRGYERAAEIGASVIVILIREASFVFGARPAEGLDPVMDPEADRVFAYARKEAQDRDIPVRTIYELSTSPMALLADHAVTLGVTEVHVGGSRRSKIEKVLRGNPLDELRNLLPPEVRLTVHRPQQGVPDPRTR